MAYNFFRSESILIEPSEGGEKLNKKIGFIILSILVFAITSLHVSLVLGQSPWYSVKVSAYGTNLIEDNLGGGSLEFTVADPPTGVEVTNTISGILSENDQNYSVNLTPGENIIVTFGGSGYVVDRNSIVAGPDAGCYIIEYEGDAGWLMVNGTNIPEFSPILIAPLFIAVTLLALFYRRKHKT